MGVEYSVFNILESASRNEVKVETTESDGRQVVTTTKKDPWVTGIVVLTSGLILITYLDGGKGMVSKSFGRVCVNCSK